MERLSDLRFLFRVVVGLEALYALVAVLTPPAQVENVTGWVLTADGQWLTKLFGLALASQAWVAWTLRNEPHLGVARGLAFYQLASATASINASGTIAVAASRPPRSKACLIFATASANPAAGGGGAVGRGPAVSAGRPGRRGR